MRQSFTTQPALFASHELFEHPALGALDAVEEVIDWSRIEALLPRGEERRQTGRPGYPAQTLFRALLLGLWYDLSDVKLSAQLARDLLFRKFCRLELDQGVPEASTLGRFRARLGDRLEAVLAEIVAMLEEARVVLAEGRIAIVDATVVEAAQSGYDRRDPEAGSAVKLTVKRLFSPDGQARHGRGIEPHFIVAGNEAAMKGPFDQVTLEADPQLRAAAELLSP